MKFKLIYFEDQISHIETYQDMLEDQLEVIGCYEPLKYEEILRLHRPHALLIDVHMPDIDGLELLRQIQLSEAYNGCPVFFVSGDYTSENRIKSFLLGGVDFFDRTLSVEEISTRLLNKIKFYQSGLPILQIGNLKLDTWSFTAKINEELVDLTMLEMRILALILRSYPVLMSKTELVSAIWGPETKEGKLYVHLSNLGQKLRQWDHQIRVKGDGLFIIPPQ